MSSFRCGVMLKSILWEWALHVTSVVNNPSLHMVCTSTRWKDTQSSRYLVRWQQSSNVTFVERAARPAKVSQITNGNIIEAWRAKCIGSRTQSSWNWAFVLHSRWSTRNDLYCLCSSMKTYPQMQKKANHWTCIAVLKRELNWGDFGSLTLQCTMGKLKKMAESGQL